MADIVYRKNGMATQLIVNGIDLTNETYRGVKLVEVGDEKYAEVGLQITLVVSTLTINTTENIKVTDHFDKVAQLVRSVAPADEVV